MSLAISSCTARMSESLPVVLLAPDMRVVAGVHQLRADRESVSSLDDSSREHRPHAELSPDGPGVHVLSFVVKGRAPRNHLDPRDLRYGVDQALGDSIAQVLGIRIASRVDERQHGQRVNRSGSRPQPEHRRGERRERSDTHGPSERAESARPRGCTAELGGAAAEPLDASPRANATSRADWKRCLRALLEAVADNPLEGWRDAGRRLRRAPAAPP